MLCYYYCHSFYPEYFVWNMLVLLSQLLSWLFLVKYAGIIVTAIILIISCAICWYYCHSYYPDYFVWNMLVLLSQLLSWLFRVKYAGIIVTAIILIISCEISYFLQTHCNEFCTWKCPTIPTTPILTTFFKFYLYFSPTFLLKDTWKPDKEKKNVVERGWGMTTSLLCCALNMSELISLINYN